MDKLAELESTVTRLENRLNDLEKRHKQDLEQYRSIQIGDEFSLNFMYEQIERIKTRLSKLENG